jgi:hypothetical protein
MRLSVLAAGAPFWWKRHAPSCAGVGLLTFLRDEQPAWSDKDHPELSLGAGPWVKRIRSEGEKRVPTAREAGRRAR